MSLLVYALASHGAGRIRLTGVRGERLEIVRVGPIDAVVGAVNGPPRATARALKRYDGIVRELWSRRAAVLPARFPSVLRDRAELELVLHARRATLRQRLAVVRHRAQMTIRIVPGTGMPGTGIRDPGSGGASPRRLTGSQYLEHRARAARLDHVPEVGVLRDAVKRWIRAERAEARAGVATIYHLVPRTAGGRYRQLIERAAADARLRLRVSGPWPPYAFAEAW